MQTFANFLLQNYLTEFLDIAHKFEVSGEKRIGLNMNYLIIFTEISFSPETSILLQIIQIIYMTYSVMDYARI